MLRVVPEEGVRAELSVDLDEICREGARRMLAAALEAERDAYLAALADERGEKGRRLVVGNGRANRRVIATGAGPVEVQAPRINDKRVDEETGERRRFRSQILAPWCRKSPKVSEVLPLMYLHGMSSGDFAPALGEFFGSDAGLSPSVVTRLTTVWQDERDRFSRRSLAEVDYVYVWVDGIHFNVRLEEERLCCLVMVGVRADGTKELVASPTATGSRPNPGPISCGIASGGACEPRCWPSATGRWASGRRCVTSSPRPGSSVAGCTSPPMSSMPCPPRSSRPPAKRWPRTETPRTASRRGRHQGLRRRLWGQVAQGGGQDHRKPASCWPSTTFLPSTGSIEDDQSDRVHLRDGSAADQGDQGSGSKAAGLAMAYKLIDSAQARWRAVNAPHLVALVRAGAVFHNGVLVERHAEAVA